MRKFSSPNILNKYKWANQLDKCIVIILHRGAPNDRMEISGNQILELAKTYFVYRNSVGEESTIPFHRVREILFEGKNVWKSTKNKT